jgi:hypothetical protein
VTAMEESSEYRVTRSKGWGPGRKIRKVIFRHLDEAPARRFYKRTPPAPGYIIALWRPDGTPGRHPAGDVPQMVPGRK